MFMSAVSEGWEMIAFEAYLQIHAKIKRNKNSVGLIFI